MGPSSLAIDPDAKAAIAAMTVQPSAWQQQRISSLVRCAKSYSAWTPLDMLQVYAQHDIQAALVDLRTPSRTATAVNSPTWVRYGYFAGDGSTSYVDTNYNPSTGPNFQRENAFAGLWTTATGQNSSSPFGWFDGTDGIAINPRNSISTGFAQARMNGAATEDEPNSSGYVGLTAGGRDGGTSYLYRDNNYPAVNRTQSTIASTAVNNNNLYAGRVAVSAYSSMPIYAVFAGAFLTNEQVGGLSYCLRTYMTSVGAQ